MLEACKVGIERKYFSDRKIFSMCKCMKAWVKMLAVIWEEQGVQCVWSNGYLKESNEG